MRVVVSYARALFLLVMTLAILPTNMVQAQVVLFQWAHNQDGTVVDSLVDPNAVPPGNSFDTATGLGTITIPVQGAGPHSVLLYVDHDMAVDINASYNELGEASGTPPSGLSWEIDL